MAAASRGRIETKVINLGYVPRKWQLELHRNMKRFSVIVVHRRGGKTIAAIMTLIEKALLDTSGNGRYVYLCPQLKQAKGVCWSYLKDYSRKVPGTRINESELWVEFPNGCRIRLYGADNIDALRGLYIDFCVVDETAQIKPSLWGEVLRPALADRQGGALFIGTAKGINLFSELYHKALDDPDWYAACYTWEQTDALKPEELQKMRDEMLPEEWQQEMECSFAVANENSLIAMDVVDAAMARVLQPSQYNFAPRVIGVDVARFGGDRSVIFCRQGSMAFSPQVFTGIDNMGLASQVAKTIEQFKPQAVFCDAGRGEGVIDRLRQLGYSIIDINFGGRPMNPKYNNKRAEMWADCGEWLKGEVSLPKIVELKRDLCTPLYSFSNQNNKFQLESKDEIKARGLKSPDIGDALAITFAYPVAAATTAPHAASASCEYDPIAREEKASAAQKEHVTDYDPIDNGPSFGL